MRSCKQNHVWKKREMLVRNWHQINAVQLNCKELSKWTSLGFTNSTCLKTILYKEGWQTNRDVAWEIFVINLTTTILCWKLENRMQWKNGRKNWHQGLSARTQRQELASTPWSPQSGGVPSSGQMQTESVSSHLKNCMIIILFKINYHWFTTCFRKLWMDRTVANIYMISVFIFNSRSCWQSSLEVQSWPYTKGEIQASVVDSSELLGDQTPITNGWPW